MTRKGTALQGFLASSALAVAFVLTQSQQSAGMNEAVIIEARSADVQSLTYFDGKRRYEVKPDPAAGPGELLVHVSAGERYYRPGAPPEHVPDRQLRGGRLAKELWAAFAPLRALRSLGKLPAERLQSLGLTDTPRRLTVNVRGVERTYRLATPPPGAVEPYLLSEDDGAAFMVHRVIMNSFSERALGLDRPHEFAANAFDRMVLTPVGRPSALAFKAIRGEGTELQLHPEQSLAASRAAIEQWHGEVFNMSVDDVLGPNEVPTSGAPQPQFRLEYWLGRDRQGWMDMALGTFRNEPRLFFRTEQSMGWMVGVAGSQTTLMEAQKLFLPH